MAFKSVREFYNEVAGIRMGATSWSLWQKFDTLREYTRQALNDGLAQYPVQVGIGHCTAVVNTLGGRVGLPSYASRVVMVRGVHSTYYDKAELPHYTVTPTINTVFLALHDRYVGTILVEYHAVLDYAPVDMTLGADSGDTLATVAGGVYDLNLWPSRGYVTIHSNTLSIPSSHKEVAEYVGTAFTSVASGTASLTGVIRNISGPGGWMTTAVAAAWPPNSMLSYTFPNRRMIKPAELQAQAAFYDYLSQDRARYDQFTAIASSQNMPLEDLLMLVGSYEARARVAARRIKPVPRPQPTRRRRPWPR